MTNRIYPTESTDNQSGILSRFISRARFDGQRPRELEFRAVVNACFYCSQAVNVIAEEYPVSRLLLSAVAANALVAAN